MCLRRVTRRQMFIKLAKKSGWSRNDCDSSRWLTLIEDKRGAVRGPEVNSLETQLTLITKT